LHFSINHYHLPLSATAAAAASFPLATPRCCLKKGRKKVEEAHFFNVLSLHLARHPTTQPVA